MDAIKVLDWLRKYNHEEDDDSTMMDVFSEACACAVIGRYTSKEIVSRIEKYEAEKNAHDIKVGSIGTSKEEKQVEKLDNEYRITKVVDKINELVDAVNELRGVE